MLCPSTAPVYSKPKFSNKPRLCCTCSLSLAKVLMVCSAFSAISLTAGSLSSTFADWVLISCNTPRISRITWRARCLGNAPTLGEMDISLSFKITSRLTSLMSPALFKASNACPAVIAPSPIMATLRASLPCSLSATAMPNAAPMEVDECPTPNTSYSLSQRLGKPAKPWYWRMVSMRSLRPVRILWG